MLWNGNGRQKDPFSAGRVRKALDAKDGKRAGWDLDVAMIVENSPLTGSLIPSIKQDSRLTQGKSRISELCRSVRVSGVFYSDIYQEAVPFETLPCKDVCPLKRERSSGSFSGTYSGLETLYGVLCGRWRQRKHPMHLIAVFAGSPAYRLNEPIRFADKGYLSLLRMMNQGLEEPPTDLDALRMLWEKPGLTKMDLFHRNLILAAPSDVYPWSEIRNWNRVRFLNCRSEDDLCRAHGDLWDIAAELLESAL